MPESSISTFAKLRRNWVRRFAVPLHRGLRLPVEAALVAFLGALVEVVARQTSLDLHFPSPIPVAAAYLCLTIVASRIDRSPDRLGYGKAMEVLAATFFTAWLVVGDILTVLPWMVLWFVLAAGAIFGWREFAHRASQRFPGFTRPLLSAAFIGNSDSAERLLYELQNNPPQRFRLVGFFDDRHARPGPLDGKLPNLGHIDNIVAYIHEHELKVVFMALPWAAGERISKLIERLRFLPLTVHLIPDQLPAELRRFPPNWHEGVVMPTLMLPPFSIAGAFAKRSLDALVAGILTISLAPVFILVAAAIRIDSPGPIFFRQQRSGQYGKTFSILKFRSLTVTSADAAAEKLVQKGDQRVTRVGGPLRKFSIDELPQILNVLLGDMSLVGPRPHASRAKAGGKIYAEVLPDYMLRYRVKPGMTGWAQINGWRGNTDTEEKLRKRVEFDFAYIDRWSFLLDLKILVLTVPSALFPPAENV